MNPWDAWNNPSLEEALLALPLNVQIKLLLLFIAIGLVGVAVTLVVLLVSDRVAK